MAANRSSSTPHSEEDGFGNRWECIKGLPTGKCGMQIVRPGKVQCDICDSTTEAMGRDARDDVIELIYEIVGAPKDAPYGDLPGYVRDALRSESVAQQPIPDEFAQLAKFYNVQDMAALVRIQEGRIERMRQQLPKLRGPESDPQNYRRG